MQDINASVTALKQLTKRIRVNLVYDPKMSFLNKEKKETLTSSLFDSLGEASMLNRVKSSHPHPAMALLGPNADKNHSKVYIKRNYLY